MRPLSRRVPRFLLLSLLALSATMAQATTPVSAKSKVIVLPPPPSNAAEFVQGVAALQAQPLDARTQHTTPDLFGWLNRNHPIPNAAKMCAALMPLIAEAQVGDDLASTLYAQSELELGAYQVQHPQASAIEAQSAAVANTLRMYANMRKQGVTATNAFAETVLADVKVRGLSALGPHTCAGSVGAATTPQ